MARIFLLMLALTSVCTARYDALSVFGEWMIGGYKAVLSPLQGSNICNFHPTCSQFAKGAIRSQGFLPGIVIGADRLIRCNTTAWSYYESYYTGEVVGGRMPDPVENHIAWLNPTDEAGLLVSARPGHIEGGTERDGAATPSLSFADYLYTSGEYVQAGAEYLRVRFTSGSPGLSGYAGLMAGESYLRALDPVGARHAFRDLSSPKVLDFTRYGIARTYFAEGKYAEVRANLDSVTSPLLARQARTLDGWTFFRQHRFAEGASRLSAIGSDEPSLHLSSMDGRDIRRRSRLASTLLSAIVPGVGQLYSGRAGDGAYSFLTVVGTGLATWWFAADMRNRDPSHVRVSIFGVLTALFYAGNVYGANTAARDYNVLQESRYVHRADSLFKLLSLEPDYSVLLDPVRPHTDSLQGTQQ